MTRSREIDGLIGELKREAAALENKNSDLEDLKTRYKNLQASMQATINEREGEIKRLKDDLVKCRLDLQDLETM